MDNVPPPFAALESELRQLDLTLARVDAERHALLTRRAGLITLLSRAAQPAAGAGPATGGGSSGRGATGPATGLGATGRDASPTTVRNVLLALGGVLLAAAVIAFTVVSWGRLGIGGRAVVLGLLTVTALAASVPLLRRALTATAEVVACLGLLLLVLDAYALHRVALPGTDATAYAAGASAVLAAVWTAYSRWLGGRVPATGPDRRSSAGPAGRAGAPSGAGHGGRAALGAAPVHGGPAAPGGAPGHGGARVPGGVTAHGAPVLGCPAAPGGALVHGGAPGHGGPAGAPRGGREAGARAGRPATGLMLVPALAVVLAQPPLILWAVSVSAGPSLLGAALLATAALDGAVALRSRHPAVRLTALVGGAVTGAAGLLSGVGISVTASALGDAARGGLLLLAAAAALLAAAVRLTALAAVPDPAAPRPVPGDAPAASAADGTGQAPGDAASGAAHGAGSGSRSVAPSGAVTDASDASGSGSGSGSANGNGSTTTGNGIGVGAANAPADAIVAAGLAGVAGLAVVTAVGGLLRIPLPGHLTVLGYLLCGAALLLAVPAAAVRRPAALGTAAAAAAVHIGALLWVLPSTAVALLGPVGWAGAVWEGAPSGARAAVAPDMGWPGTLAVPAVLAVVTGSLLVARRLLAGPLGAGPVSARPLGAGPGVGTEPGAGPSEAGAYTGPGPGPGTGSPSRGTGTGSLGAGVSARVRRRRSADCGVVAVAAATAAVLPVALDLPYPVAVALLVAQVAVLLGAAATPASVPVSRTALFCATAVAVTAGFWGLAERPEVTVGVLAVLLLTFAPAAANAPAADRVRQPVTACAAAVCAVGLAVALCAGAGLPAHRAAYAVLAVAAATLLPAARLRDRPAGLPLEWAAGGAALLATGLAATGPAAGLSSVLALTGVVAAGCALRADRRPAGYAATALFVLATWVRLGASGIDVPEAYTLPVSVPALVIGLLRSRQGSPASSWVLYGPGLSVTLLPSLLAAWGDSGWVRPLSLGLAALGLTLLGARRRLRAPLLLGGAVLALVTLHELAPYVVQVVDALPRWLPPALAGLLLLGIGATYEQRLRDARRVRDTLARMR